MRVIFPMFDTAFQIAALKTTNIKSINQLANKRVGVGPPAGTAGTYMPEIFKVLGLSPIVRHGSWDDMKIQALAGELDAVAFVGGVPFPALTELNTVQPVEFIVPSSEQIDTVRKALPEMSASLVSKGTYPSLMADYHTIGLFNFAIAHKDLPDDLVYGIVKATFQNTSEMVQAQASARETIPANIRRNNVLPVHPGAARYYHEAGIAVPP
jgi:TRAP transporter TAXI family solute receptor